MLMWLCGSQRDDRRRGVECYHPPTPHTDNLSAQNNTDTDVFTDTGGHANRKLTKTCESNKAKMKR